MTSSRARVTQLPPEASSSRPSYVASVCSAARSRRGRCAGRGSAPRARRRGRWPPRSRRRARRRGRPRRWRRAGRLEQVAQRAVRRDRGEPGGEQRVGGQPGPLTAVCSIRAARPPPSRRAGGRSGPPSAGTSAAGARQCDRAPAAGHRRVECQVGQLPASMASGSSTRIARSAAKPPAVTPARARAGPGDAAPHESSSPTLRARSTRAEADRGADACGSGREPGRSSVLAQHPREVPQREVTPPSTTSDVPM